MINKLLKTTVVLWVMQLGLNTHAYFDATDEHQALTMIAIQDASYTKLRKACGQAIPEYKNLVDYWFFKWYLNNEKEVLAANLYTKRKDSSVYDKLLEAGQDSISRINDLAAVLDRKKMCFKFMVSIKEGKNDVRVTTPKASQFALRYYYANPLTEEQELKYNFEQGCIRAGINKGMDFDEMGIICKCNQEVHFSELSESEFELFDKSVRDGVNVYELPEFADIIPLVNKCVLQREREKIDN